MDEIDHKQMLMFVAFLFWLWYGQALQFILTFITISVLLASLRRNGNFEYLFLANWNIYVKNLFEVGEFCVDGLIFIMGLFPDYIKRQDTPKNNHGIEPIIDNFKIDDRDIQDVEVKRYHTRSMSEGPIQKRSVVKDVSLPSRIRGAAQSNNLIKKRLF